MDQKTVHIDPDNELDQICFSLRHLHSKWQAINQINLSHYSIDLDLFFFSVFAAISEGNVTSV